MKRHMLETGRSWTVTVSGEALGQTFKDDSLSIRSLEYPGTLPTQEAAERVARAFKRWIEAKFPGKAEPKGQYFVAFPGLAVKVYPSWKPESEAKRRENGNHFTDQSDAHRAADALKWLCERERKAFEDAIQSVQA